MTNSYPQNANYQYDLLRSLAEMDVLQAQLRQTEFLAQLELLNQAVEIGEKLVDRYPTVTDFQMEISHAYNKIAILLRQRKRNASIEEGVLLDIEIENAFSKAYQHQLALTRLNPEGQAFKVWTLLFALNWAETEPIQRLPDKRNQIVKKAIEILDGLPDDVRQRRLVQTLSERAKRLSLLGIADPPAVEDEDELE